MVFTEAFWHTQYPWHLKYLFNTPWWDSGLAKGLHIPLWLSFYYTICRITLKVIMYTSVPPHWIMSSLGQELCLTFVPNSQLRHWQEQEPVVKNLQTSILEVLIDEHPLPTSPALLHADRFFINFCWPELVWFSLQRGSRVAKGKAARLRSSAFAGGYILLFPWVRYL